MLTQNQYNKLWTDTLGLPIQSIPCYYQYLQREVYYHDYLDLFCCPNNGNPTYTRVNINGQWVVHIAGLAADPTEAYTVIDTHGNVRLIVDYDYPFNGQLCQNRTIKYILIGEAAPSPSLPLMTKNGDKGNSYFYNAFHINSTPYFNAPVKAFAIRGKNKIQKLIALANIGVFLLDLFPFALSYNSATRGWLNTTAKTNNFWNNSQNPYCIENRINSIAGCLQNDWDLCLMATPIIDLHLITQTPINVPICPGLHPIEFHTAAPHPYRCNSSNYRKITNSKFRMSPPTAALIIASF